jgi:uncharacterized damage-inducible protein DinB
MVFLKQQENIGGFLKMEKQIHSVFNQLHIAIRSLVEITEQVEEGDLEYKPAKIKRSIGELLSHLSVICKADFLIFEGATQEEMKHYYAANTPKTLKEINTMLFVNYKFLEEAYLEYANEELEAMKTSYWGVTYSRFEWLLEILCHVYHHRAQLHSWMIQLNKEPKVTLFE